MTLDILTEQTEFILDQDYLIKHGADFERIKKALESDLNNKERVALQPPTNPRLNPLYSDVLPYISIQSRSHGFLLCPTNEYDLRKIRKCLGNRVIKEKDGYRFK